MKGWLREAQPCGGLEVRQRGDVRHLRPGAAAVAARHGHPDPFCARSSRLGEKILGQFSVSITSWPGDRSIVALSLEHMKASRCGVPAAVEVPAVAMPGRQSP